MRGAVRVVAVATMVAIASVALSGCAIIGMVTGEVRANQTRAEARAANAEVEADISQANTSLLEYEIDNDVSNLDTVTLKELAAYGFVPTKGTSGFQFHGHTLDKYCLQETSSDGVTYKLFSISITHLSDVVPGACVEGTNY